MEDKTKKTFDALKSIRLSESEKSEMKKALVNVVESTKPTVEGLQRSPYKTFMRPAFAVVIVFVLLVGSVSYAAESSLPGDPLYFVKTSINEPVRGALAVTPKSKAAWKARLAVRRVDEVESLLQKPVTSAKESSNTLMAPAAGVREEGQLADEASFGATLRVGQDSAEHPAYGVAERVRERLLEERAVLEDELGDDDVDVYVETIDSEIRRLDSISGKGFGGNAPRPGRRDEPGGETVPGGSGDAAIVEPGKGDEYISPEPKPIEVELEPIETEPDNILILDHEYEEGLHTYSGVLTVPTPCHGVSVTSTYFYSNPPRGEIQLEIISNLGPNQGACVQVEDEQYFEAEFEGPKGFEITSVTLNGEPIMFEIGEPSDWDV